MGAAVLTAPGRAGPGPWAWGLTLLAAVALGLQFVLPYATAPVNTVADAAGTFNDGVFNLNDRLGLLINAGLALALAIAAIFLFKNRPVQSRITTIAIFAATILAVSLATQCYFLIREVGAAVTNIHYQVGVALPAFAVLLMWVANRFIRKDEALVRSSDRLR